MVVIMPLWCFILTALFAVVGVILGAVAIYALLNEKGE